MLLQAQAMIYAIEKINESPMLPDVFIGYKMYDTCGDVFVAARGTLKLIEQSGGDPNGGDAVEMCPSLEETPGPGEEGVMAVIGERDSEVSTVVARLMALPMIAQVNNQYHINYVCQWIQSDNITSTMSVSGIKVKTIAATLS